jgi:elongation factor 2
MKITEQIRQLMNQQDRIRNIAIVAHIDHGKTTFADNLLAASGLLSKDLAGKMLAMDFKDDERERGITIDAAVASLVYTQFDTKKEFIIHLVDTPGHVDFSGEVSRALRAVDGCIVLVDAVEGIMPQTETVLKQALQENVKPILFINKIDRLINELRLNPVQIQQKLSLIVSAVNDRIELWSTGIGIDESWFVTVENDSVCLGSSVHQWALSASMMKKKNITLTDVIEMYNSYTSEEENASANESQAPPWKKLSQQIPLAETVFESLVRNIPSPNKAQSYRVPGFLQKNADGNAERKIKGNFSEDLLTCNQKGGLAFTISKINTDQHAGPVCTGRIFSGTLKQGQEVFLPKAKRKAAIGKIYLQYGSKKETIPEAAAGNIVSVTGLKDAFAGETVTDNNMTDFGDFPDVMPAFEPVVTKTIEPKKSGEMDKLKEVLEQLHHEDPFLKIEANPETGENLISGVGELHLEIIENRIRSDHGLEIITGSPVVVYRETVLQKNNLADNKEVLHDEKERFFFSFIAEPASAKEKKGLAGNKNLLVITAELPDMKQKDSVKTFVEDAFASVMNAGIKMTLVNASIPSDSLKGNLSAVKSSIESSLRNSMRDAMKHASPALLEPVQTLRFEMPPEYIGEISKLIAGKRGSILDIDQTEIRVTIKAKLAVAETIGLASDVRSVTGGKASFSVVEQNFELVPEDMQEKLVYQIKKRKGLFVSST